MRLHSLSVTAFGPFADTVEVDFDALAEAQVFLLCGEIGAGKTTVLDAVCFALYGDVPTDRGRARALRSHFAAADAEPLVVLEIGIDGRRFRFTRSPVWQRPKKRGHGTTTAQPSVLVEERAEAGWTVRATRLDEAGLLVGDLLGMTLPQFSQVVMLPQGQFDTFLRASSEDRQRVLTRLFRTHRFEDVERWVAERRASLRRAGEAQSAEVGTMLHRVSEAAATDLPPWDDLALAAADGSIEAWLADQTSAAEVAVGSSATEQDAAAAALDEAVTAEGSGRRTHELWQRHERAHLRSAALEASSESHHADRERLAGARRAALVTASRRAADDARRRAEQADEEATRAVAAVADLLDEADRPDRHVLDRRAVAAAERAALAAGFVPRARELAASRERVVALTIEVAALTARHDEVDTQAAALPEQVVAVEERLGSLRHRAAREEAHRARLVDLARQVTRFATLTELQFQVADFTAKRDQQQSVVLDLRQRLLDVREARLHGMAAELASAMAVGASCPVCGSHEHPDPAEPGADTPDRDTEQGVQSSLDDAEVLLETHRDQVRSYATRLVVVSDELAGVTEVETVSALESAQQQLADALVAAREVEEQEQQLLALRAAVTGVGQLAAALDADLAVATEQRSHAVRDAARLTQELTEILGTEAEPLEAGGDDIVAAVESHARRGHHAAGELARARDALTEQAQLRDHADRAHGVADEVARAQGFASAQEAGAMELSAQVVTSLEADIADRSREEAEVAATLTDPETVAAAAIGPVDVEALAVLRRHATQRHAVATTSADLAGRRRQRLTEQAAGLRAALERWRPLREDYAVVRSLSELAEGKGPDNPTQMRLSAYVLAARLGQVVAAANERLTRMTDGRYLLEHTARRGVGERRGGLSLLVQDLWTDGLRDPVTLSGGETFVVSLALALGLADVVTAEAGGTSIDTLFVDEGFGTLDGDTLELVMDTLDDLRSGGRVVGVVSHVPELRTRIPAQLVVRKTRSGSSLEQTR